MNDLAKLIRTDRGLAINETRIREEVIRVMDLERDIANVSTYTQTHTHTHTLGNPTVTYSISKNSFCKTFHLFFEKLRKKDLVSSNSEYLIFSLSFTKQKDFVSK